MTTGTFTRDDSVPFGAGWNGLKWTRTWSGADRAPLPVPPGRVLHKVVERLVFNKAGQSTLIKVPIYRYPPESLASERKPKRDRDEDHAYTLTDLYRSDQIVTYFDQGGGGVWKQQAAMVFGASTWSATPLLTANDQIRLVNKLGDQLSGSKDSDFNMAVVLGEHRQTLRLLGDSAIRIAKSLHHLRRGDIAGSARSLLEGSSRRPIKRHDWRTLGVDAQTALKPTAETVSSLWLELQYGWKPLIEDAKGACEMVAHLLSSPAQRTYRAAVYREERRTTSLNLGFGKTITGDSLKYHRRGIIAKIREAPSVYAQLGLLDPELVIWELMPWSFVADWFIPIGSWMQARALSGRLKGTFVTSDKQVGYRFRPESNAPGDWAALRCGFKNCIFSRTISTVLDVPMPTLKPLSKVASWEHCANAVALVTQKLLGNNPSKGFTSAPQPAASSLRSEVQRSQTASSRDFFRWSFNPYP